MRQITFLWFWDVCWDNTRAWTIIFSIFVPIVAIFVCIEIFEFLNNKKVSSFSTLSAVFATLIICECILKPIFDIGPFEDSCTFMPSNPSSTISIASTMTSIYALRLLNDKQFIHKLFLWGISLALAMISFPILHYFSWINGVLSIVPGALIGILWTLVFEKNLRGKLGESLSSNLSLSNDFSQIIHQQ